MAAALRVFCRRPDASPARLLPSWLPGPSPKLYAPAGSRFPYTRGVHSSPNPVPSTLLRFWSVRSRGGDAAAGLASGRRACLPPLQVPSLLPVRHHGSTPTKQQLNSWEERIAARDEAMEYMQDAVGKLPDIDRSVARAKRNLWILIGLLAVSAYPFFQMCYLAMLEVAILELRVEELEKPLS